MFSCGRLPGDRRSGRRRRFKPMTEARRDKVSIEDPLLLRRQNRPDTNVRGDQELAALF